VNRCTRCSGYVASRWSRCPWCRGWTGQGRDSSDGWRDARLDGLQAFGLSVAVWLAALAFVRASTVPAEGWIIAAVAGAVALGHLALTWHAAAWYLAEGGWGAAAVLAPFIFRGEPPRVAAGAAAMPLVIFALMRCVRWPLLDRLHGRSTREEPVSYVVALLRTEARAVTVGTGLMAGLVLAPILAALLFPD
jgi:hypothetical protein